MATYETRNEAIEAGNTQAHLVDSDGGDRLSTEIVQCDRCGLYGYRSDHPGEWAIVSDDGRLTCDDCADDINDLPRAVAALVGDDGTGDIGIIARTTVHHDITATDEEIAEIVREARAEHAANRAAEVE
jgi:hypothetical protein